MIDFNISDMTHFLFTICKLQEQFLNGYICLGCIFILQTFLVQSFNGNTFISAFVKRILLVFLFNLLYSYFGSLEFN